MKVTLIVEINVHGTPGHCTLYAIPGGYDDRYAGCTDTYGNYIPSFDERDDTIKIIEGIDSSLVEIISEGLATLLSRLGHEVDKLAACDD